MEVFEVRASGWLYFFSYLLVALGVVSVVWQIEETAGFYYYFSEMISGGGSQLRESYLVSSSEGGIPGYIKMFHIFPVSFFIFYFSIFTHFNLSPVDRSRVKRVMLVALGCSIFCALLVMNRVAFLGIIMAFFVGFLYKGGRRLIYFFVLMAPVVFIVSIISRSRLEGFGALDFVFLYSKLGLYNFELVIGSLSCHSFGYSTVFSWVEFVLRFLGGAGEACSGYDWVWNPAQNLFSYLYIDFDIFFLVALFFVGFVFSILQQGFFYGGVEYKPLYYMVVWAVSTSFTVPIFRSFEFFLAIVVLMVFVRSWVFCVYSSR